MPFIMPVNGLQMQNQSYPMAQIENNSIRQPLPVIGLSNATNLSVCCSHHSLQHAKDSNYSSQSHRNNKSLSLQSQIQTSAVKKSLTHTVGCADASVPKMHSMHSKNAIENQKNDNSGLVGCLRKPLHITSLTAIRPMESILNTIPSAPDTS